MSVERSGFDRISEHVGLPTWRGRLADAAAVSTGRNPLCGDEIRLEVRWDGDRIGDIRFDGRGCVVSQACASMLCEGVVGKSIDEVRCTPASQLMDFDASELTVNRQRCASLGYEILQRMLASIGTR